MWQENWIQWIWKQRGKRVLLTYFLNNLFWFKVVIQIKQQPECTYSPLCKSNWVKWNYRLSRTSYLMEKNLEKDLRSNACEPHLKFWVCIRSSPQMSLNFQIPHYQCGSNSRADESWERTMLLEVRMHFPHTT